MQWLPFALANFHSYLDSGRRRDLRLAMFFFVLQALSSGHGAVFAAVSLTLVFAWRLCSRRRADLLRLIRDIGWPGAVIAAPLIASMVPVLDRAA